MPFDKNFIIFYIFKYIKLENKLQFFEKCYIIDMEKFFGFPSIRGLYGGERLEYTKDENVSYHNKPCCRQE